LEEPRATVECRARELDERSLGALAVEDHVDRPSGEARPRSVARDEVLLEGVDRIADPFELGRGPLEDRAGVLLERADGLLRARGPRTRGRSERAPRPRAAPRARGCGSHR